MIIQGQPLQAYGIDTNKNTTEKGLIKHCYINKKDIGKITY
jgi:hypothetical protein